MSVQQELDLKVYTLELISAPKTVRFFGEGCTLLAGSPTHVSILDFNQSGSVEFSKDNTSYAFSAKSNTLALGQSGGLIQIFDTATGKRREVLKGGATPKKIKISLNGDFLAAANGNGTSLINLNIGKTEHHFPGGGWQFGQFHFSPDERYFAAGVRKSESSLQHTVYQYDLSTKTIDREFSIEGTITQLLFSPNGEKLLVSTTDPGGIAYETRLHLFDTASGKELFQWESDEGIVDVVFSPNSKVLAIGTAAGALIQNGVVRLLDANNGTEKDRFMLDNVVVDLDMSPDGQLVSVVSGTYSMWKKKAVVFIYNMNEHRIVYNLNSKEFFNMNSFSSDGRFLVVGGRGSSVQLLEFKKN
ncbi:WD40 repeat domain-containing protein [Desulfovibrio ferrophilus]|uniref:WD40 repeat domain-containing protein n=1 Tax=Desulfovibrio ferrophilus TaxID=241368 RepID=UPI000F836A62|nr:hypothetical protein [Desulfovibrio ferrophilus]